jgi:hypothetical protein
MIFRLNPSLPPISRRDMLIQRPFLALLRVKVLPICSTGHSIIVPEHASCPEFREQEIDDILE